MINKYFSDSLDFRAQIFNSLAIIGILLGVGLAVFSAIIQANIMVITANLLSSVFGFVIVIIANRTKRFKLCFLITVIVLFIIIFPILFFSGGGYHSSMPSFFVFAIVFTVIMLEGWRRGILTILEFILYLGCFLTAYYWPETITSFATEAEAAQDTIVGCLAASAVLAAAIHRHIVVYDRRQKELEKANDQLHGLNRMKTEFLQDIKHEIRNPLHVIAYCADSVHHYINTGTNAEDAKKVLNVMQNEAVRLGRMINGMVELATISGSAASRKRIDFTAMLNHCVETFHLRLEQKHIALCVDIAPNLPYVYAEAEQLERVPVNLLSNAVNYTQEGEITLAAKADEGYIIVMISDTGEGIDPELLPRVFERGVSGKGGKGYGLSICKTIVEAHGGSIEIESEQKKGTAVTFTVPVYGGQSEARDHE